MADRKQQLETKLVFNAQDAIKNITALKTALDSVNKITFNNLRTAMESIQGVIKATSAQSEKSAKTVEKQVKKEKDLLQQRAALHQKMIDAYSKNPKIDLSGAVKEYERLNQKITDMYTSMGKPKQALNALKDAMLMTANTPWADKVVKQYERLALMIDTVNKKQKAILENANGTTEAKSTSGANKAYDAMIAQGDKKAEQMRRMWEQLDKEQAKHQQQVEAQTQKEIASYERQQRAIEAGQDAILKSIIRHNKKVEAERERALREEQKVRLALSETQSKQQQAAGKDQTRYFNQIMNFIRKIEQLENKINSHKGADGLVYTKRQLQADLAHFNELKRKAEEFGALNIASMMQHSIFDGVNVKSNLPKQTAPMQTTTSKTSYAEEQARYMRELRSEAERFYHTWKQTRDVDALMNFRVKASEIQAMNKEARTLNDMFGRVNRSLLSMDNLLDKIKMRAGWVTTGLVENFVINSPDEVIRQLSQYELAMAGVAQVLPKLEQTDEFGKVTMNQAEMNKEFAEFSKIASDYGHAAMEVLEAGRSIGRMYGDGDGDRNRGMRNTNLLTRQAARMSAVDNFDMMDATRGLEATLSQFEMQTSNTEELLARTNEILDVWTKLSHRGGASAQDLVDGVRQAGSAAHEAGVSFEFLNAMIATGVRATAKSGNEIGTTLKSMFSSILSDKNIKNMEKFGIDIYKTAEDGTKRLRSMEEVILEISMAMKGSGANAKELRDFMMVVSGGKQQFSKVEAILGNWKELLRTIKEANSSQGFTEEQLGLQLDTISRKLEGIKALWANLLMSNGGAGFTNDIKWFLNCVKQLSVGFKKMNDDWYSFTKTVLLGAIAIGGVSKVMTLLARSYGRFNDALKNGYKTNTPAFIGGYSPKVLKAEAQAAEQAQAISQGRGKTANTGATTANTEATTANTAANTANTESLVANTGATAVNTESIVANNAARTASITSKEAEGIAQSANTTSTATNTTVRLANYDAIIAGNMALNLSNIATSSSTDVKTANNVVTEQNTVLENANTASTEANTVARNANSMVVNKNTINMAGYNAVLLTGVSNVGKLTQATNIAKDAMIGLGTVSNGLRGVIAALGGPVGAALTAISLLATAYGAYAMQAGEAEIATEKLKDALDEQRAKAQEDIDVWEKRTDTCANLSEVYNHLAESIKNENLDEEQAIETKKQMADIEETVSGIMHMSAENLVQDGEMKIANIKAEGKAQVQKAYDAQVAMRNQVKSDISATQSAIDNCNARIDAANGEIDALGELAKAYANLGKVLAGFYKWRADSLHAQITELENQGVDKNEKMPLGDLMAGVTYDDLKKSAAALDAKVNEFNEENPYAALEFNKAEKVKLEGELESLNAHLEDLNNDIAVNSQKLAEFNEDNSPLADNGYSGSGDSTGGHGSGGKSGGSNPSNPSTNTESNENKFDKAELNRIKNELDGKLKYIDNALKGLDTNAEIYGMTDSIMKSKEHWYEMRSKVLEQYKGLFKGAYDDLMAKSNDLWDEETVASAGSELANQIIDAASEWLGTPYLYGGTSKSGVDCSAFVQNVYDAAGVAISRMADTQAEDFASKGLFHHNDGSYTPQKGDAVFMYYDGTEYGTVQGEQIGHVGIYNGDGTVTHASASRGVITVDISDLMDNITGFGDFNSYAGHTGAGVKVPNPIPSAISKEQWSNLDLEGKRAFIEAHKEESAEWKGAFGRFNNILSASKEIADVFAKEAENERERSKARVEDANKNIETKKKEADFEATTKLFVLGLDASDVDKAEIELEKLQKTIDAISGNIDKYPENSIARKEKQQELENAKTEYESKAIETRLQRANYISSSKLKMLDDEYDFQKSNPYGVPEKVKHDYYKERIALLEEELANVTEVYNKQESELSYRLALKKEEIELEESQIEKEKELVRLGQMQKDVLDEHVMALDNKKRAWNEELEVGTQNTRSLLEQQKALKKELTESKIEANSFTVEVGQAIQNGTVSMFQGVLLEGKSFKDGWQALWKQIASIAIQKLISVYIFQKALGSIFGGGWFSGGGSVSSGSGGYNVGSGGGFFNLAAGFANGGFIPKYADGGILQDGLIKGAGTGTSDSILTYLKHRNQFILTSNGEYIIQKKAVDALGTNFLDIINKSPEAIKSLNRYADGGSIGSEMVPAMNTITSANYQSYTEKTLANESTKNKNARLESLMAEQTGVIREMGSSNDSGGKIVVLNTQASSADVLRALQENPRALNAILGRNERRGFR